MKIEVDLGDVFCDEDGNPEESIQDSIERQVVSHLTKKIEAGIGKQIDAEVSRVISETLKTTAETLLPSLAADMLNAKYMPVSKWGDKEGPTTFRQQLVKDINKQMVYKKERSIHDRNAFTKCVDEVIEEQMKAFQTEFNKLVNERFRSDALAYAVSTLKRKLGLTEEHN